MGQHNNDDLIIIKKYANRRLYNTATSSYVTLEHLAQMVREGLNFQVVDAKSGDDITRTVLTQIIVEEESKGEHLLPISFLRQLISFYGDNMQFLVPRYLEMSMDSFKQNQDQMKDQLHNTFSGMFPFGEQFEEMGRKNMEMFEQTMKMFNPMGVGMPDNGQQQASNPKPEEPNLSDLQQQLSDLQSQLADIAKAQKTDK